VTAAVGSDVSRQPGPDDTVAVRASGDDGTPRRAAGWMTRLRDAIFPEAPATPVSRRQLVIGAGLLAFGVIYSLGRVRGVGALDGVFAEDGANFLADAANRSMLDAVLNPVNGYYLTYQRVLAEITTAFPISLWASVNAIFAAVSTVVLAFVVYAASGAHLRHPALRLMAAAPVVMQWVANGEIVDNVATLQFPALYAIFWLLLGVQTRRSGKIAAPIFTAVAALSTILTITLIPLALARTILRRDRTGLLMTVTLVLGGAVQLLGMATGNAERSNIGESPRFEPQWILDQFANVQVPVAFLGEGWIQGEVVHTGEHKALIALAWAVPLAALVLALLRRTRPAWILAAIAAAYAVALFALQIALIGRVPGRYLLPSMLLLVTTVIALLLPRSWDGGTSWTGPEGFGTVPIVVLATLLAVVALANYRLDHVYRTPGVPSWSKQVTANTEKCRQDPALPAVTFQSGPLSKRAWGAFPVPCDRLR
jgi:hypothetical protein